MGLRWPEVTWDPAEHTPWWEGLHPCQPGTGHRCLRASGRREGGHTQINLPGPAGWACLEGASQAERAGSMEGSLRLPGLCCETLGEWVRSGFDTRPRACGRCEPRTQTPTPSGRCRVIKDSCAPWLTDHEADMGPGFYDPGTG